MGLFMVRGPGADYPVAWNTPLNLNHESQSTHLTGPSALYKLMFIHLSFRSER